MNRYQDAVDKAVHHIAIGNTEIHLWDDRDLPWEKATSVRAGSGFRHGVTTTLSFESVHPCGLTFAWSLDVELREANGSGTLQPALDMLSTVAAKVPPEVATQMRECLREVADKMNEFAVDWEKHTAEARARADEMTRFCDGLTQRSR